MATELDTLMDILPDELGAKNIDALIAYHRDQRAKRESGVKVTKEAGPKQKLGEDILGSLLKDRPKTEVVVKRRI